MRVLMMVLCLSLAAVAVLLSGCGGSDAPLPAVALTATDLGNTVILHVGQSLEYPMELWTAATGPAFRYDCQMTPSSILEYQGQVTFPDGYDGLLWRAHRVGRAEVAVIRSPVGPLMIPAIIRRFTVVVR